MKKFYKDKTARFDSDALYYFFGKDREDAYYTGGWYVDKTKKEMLRECKIIAKWNIYSYKSILLYELH